MITGFSILIGFVVASMWGIVRRRGLGIRRVTDEAHFPKLEAAWLGCFIFSVVSFFGERFIGNPIAQVLSVTELWVGAFPFLIMVTILLFFSLKMTKSVYFRQKGLTVNTWKFLVFPPLGALLLTVPAVEVFNRITDFSPPQVVESVVQEKIAFPAAFFRAGGHCAIVVKNPLQDGELWTLRVSTETCAQTRENITPIKISLRDGRFGIAYIDGMEVTAP